MRRTAAVLGSPISHSLSPLIHNYAYQILQFQAEYIAAEVREGEFLGWIRAALTNSTQWMGFSLTMPLKEVVCSPKLRDLINLDSAAEKIQSANTLYYQDEKWQGCSTDVMGFEYLLETREFSKVAIVGAGGTARAAIAALSKMTVPQKMNVKVFRRDDSRDLKLSAVSDKLIIEFVDFAELERQSGFDLLINTVPNDGVSQVASGLKDCKLLLDAVYTPWPTALMSKQYSDGAEVISGLQLLCAQAVPQIRLMTGLDFDSIELYERLLKKVQQEFN